ncbi:protein odr-4 homolog [Patella vulgata]|uniref:protein odr-4 homolog n=1 Tax=Patella vulgata TaxID=6465 RepID=UPI0024A8D082|nr:protein odr-4 homolog [Patella vulgata]
MGRSIHADEAIQDYVEELIKSGQWYIGLILGQLTNPRDYILRLARTPDPVEDEASEEEDLEDIVPKKKPKKKGSRRPKTLDEMDDSWVATHAKQVIRMLPGGLEVAGVFILSPPNISQKVTEKLRQVVYAVHRSINKPGLLPTGEITDRITLHICSLTRKITCRTYDVEDNNSNGHPAEWRYHPINDKWIQLNTSAFLDITIPVPSLRKSSTLIKQIQMGLTPFYQSLSTSIGLINGAFRDTSELLEMASGKKSRSKDKSFMMPQSYNVELMIKKGDGKKVADPQVTSVSSMIVLRGQMIGRAFIQGKPTVGDVIQAVKVDLARSISSRCVVIMLLLQAVKIDLARSCKG